MCVVSMVIDHYQPIIPNYEPFVPKPVTPFTSPAPLTLSPLVDLAELRKIIDEFKEALAAAKAVDRLTGQPDCEDPEKAKLIQRVAELEKQLGRPARAWVLKRGNDYLDNAGACWFSSRHATRFKSLENAREWAKQLPGSRVVRLVKKESTT